jgi:CheY-like chemotaxis protein
VSIRVFSDPRSFIDFSKLLSFQECKVLVMDYSMPYMTGFEVFKELYEHTQGVLPPKMILYTANLEQIGKSEIEFMQGIGIELLKKPSVRVLIEKILDNL